ncbi:MAG: hypothetical protein HY744_06585 [Deltaproteobacteria bacterium]|nr:hypothetical protein [Deltaproteobacteria bacterium]
MVLRLPAALVALLGALAAAAGCSTYRSDLDRAMQHYNTNQYDAAVRLFEVLEVDLDSLSDAEQAQYACYRGMSYYRLGQRADARHWLGVSAAINKVSRGALAPDEDKRVTETLDDLNRDVYGGAAEVGGASCIVDSDCGPQQYCAEGRCTAAPPGGAAPAPVVTAAPAGPAGQPCGTSVDCPRGFACVGGTCTSSTVRHAPPGPAATAAPVPAPAPKAAQKCQLHTDCEGAQICENGVCVSPIGP